MRYQIFKNTEQDQYPKYVVIDTYEYQLIINCNDKSSAIMYVEGLKESAKNTHAQGHVRKSQAQKNTTKNNKKN